MGPVAWSVIFKYATEYIELEEDLVRPFTRIMRALDDSYLAGVAKNKPKPEDT